MSDDREPNAPAPEEAESEPNRRNVLDAALVGGSVLLAGTAAYPIVRYLNAPQAEETVSEVVAGKASAVAAGTAVAFRFGNKPGLLVRDEFGKLRAFIAICTHLDCVVQFRKDIGHIWCACHNGHFDLTGRNIQGPPPRPLEQLSVQVRDGDVVVSKEA